MFMPEYLEPLILIGQSDVETRLKEIAAFLAGLTGVDPCAPPALGAENLGFGPDRAPQRVHRSHALKRRFTRGVIRVRL